MQRCTFCRTEIGSVHWAFDGVSEPRDNDTIAAIVGAAAGALHGAAALPARWVDQLPGYTRVHDEGEVQQIIARARERWG